MVPRSGERSVSSMKRSLFFAQYLRRNTVSCCGNFRSCTSVYTPSSFPRTPCLARIYCAKISLHNLVLVRADRLRISLSGLRSPSGFAVISTVASGTSETEKSPVFPFRYTFTTACPSLSRRDTSATRAHACVVANPLGALLGMTKEVRKEVTLRSPSGFAVISTEGEAEAEKSPRL